MSLDEESADNCFIIERPKDQRKGDLERTIQAMEGSSSSAGGEASCDGICAHPLHLHSFQQVNFLLSLRNCAGCQARIQTIVFGAGNDSAKQVVRCLACGVYAHRRCAMNNQLAQALWKETCPVNREKIDKIMHKQAFENNPSPISNDAFLDVGGDDKPSENQASPDESCHSDPTLEWTTDGPPEHWAKVPNPPVVQTASSGESLLDKEEEEEEDVNVVQIAPSGESLLDEEEEDAVNVDLPLHYASHPFASVSTALQENILAHFRNRGINENATEEEKKDAELKRPLLTESIAANGELASRESPNPVVQFVSGTVNAVRTTVSIPGRLGAAAVAGGIAGGVAGLAIAGPAGAIAGCQFGKTAGALGVLLEGSVSVGVFVASVATGSAAGKHIHEHLEERRILEMGERGASRKVLLVRPNIKIDTCWETFCKEAAAGAPRSGGLFAQAGVSKERYRRDDDIVQQSEEEIPTNDKVFLLVSRILNDKDSLPGHVYRSLIEKFFERVRNRKELHEEGYADSEASGRICRDDTHAIIKFVTATLLEVRPGLDSSPSITELAATAVESLVFGKVYDDVFNEITEEAAEKDAALLQKIEQCENDPQISKIVSGDISSKALLALQRLPTAHSAVNKLEDCVHFLESISEHFSSTGDTTKSLCADSLLKMVCQHILMARVDRLNAEIAFLEEFARDEQLLRGREGYALVTLQAALHFLNMCENIERDIFGQDNEEENLPLTGSSDLDDSVEFL